MIKAATVIEPLVLTAAQADALEIITCDADHDVPSKVEQELDKVLTNMVQPQSELVPIFGVAPGGGMAVHRLPRWLHHATNVDDERRIALSDSRCLRALAPSSHPGDIGDPHVLDGA